MKECMTASTIPVTGKMGIQYAKVSIIINASQKSGIE
jgi:hypothetical protein